MANLYPVTIRRLVSEKTGIDPAIVQKVMDGLRKVIVEAVVRGDRVYWTRFLVLAAQTKAPSRRFNPGSGLYVEIPGTERIRIAPDEHFLNRVKETASERQQEPDV